MIKISAYIRKINYNTLLELMMPHIEEWLTQKDTFFYDILNKILSNKNKPTKFSKLLVSAIPKKTNISAWIMQNFDEALMEYLNNLLKEKHVYMRITSIHINSIERGNEAMLKLEITMDNIDYEKTIEEILPVLIEKLSQKDDKGGRIGYLLLSLKELPIQVVKAAINAIPTEQRDSLMAAFLSEYKEEMADAINRIITINNIKAEISDIHISH